MPLLVLLLDEVDELVTPEAKLPDELLVLAPEVLVPAVARPADVLPTPVPVQAPRLKAITHRVAQPDDERFESIRPPDLASSMPSHRAVCSVGCATIDDANPRVLGGSPQDPEGSNTRLRSEGLEALGQVPEEVGYLRGAGVALDSPASTLSIASSPDASGAGEEPSR